MQGEGARTRHRTASCQCGGLRLYVSGEPDFVNICHCQFCQRRSGSAFSYNAYFARHVVDVSGVHSTFSRPGSEGRQVRNQFCPSCGTTLFWHADLRPDYFGVAVGAFNDPAFASPMASLWEVSINAWLTLPKRLPRYRLGLPTASTNKITAGSVQAPRGGREFEGDDL